MKTDPTQVTPADIAIALAGVHARPLWDRYQRVTRRAPSAPDAPMCWAWDTMEPMVARAIREVGLEEAERRVLLLTHPAFHGAAVTTTNLSAGLQTLLPGETARAHRHTIQAIRFVREGRRAVTSVNSHHCDMAEGDLVLTPAWTWHEHIHPGAGRMVWFDGLDLPLCTYLDTMFFEMSEPGASATDPPATRAPALRANAATLAPDAFDLRNPGSSRIGDTTIHWKRNDVLSLPHWNWISHTATAGDALVFRMTDRELLASLAYLREEESAAP